MGRLTFSFELANQDGRPNSRMQSFAHILDVQDAAYTHILARQCNVTANPHTGGIVYSGYLDDMVSAEKFKTDIEEIANRTNQKVAKIDLKME